jgi:Na+/melibiose symporter-like transporter
MLTADLVRACLIGLLILAAGNLTVDPMHHAALQIPLMLGVTYTSIGLITAASWFFIPARVALIGDIVEDRHRERASGLAQTSEAVVTIAGPAVAAPLFFTVGVGWALAIDGLSFLVSFVAVWLVHAPPPARSVEEGQSGNLRAELSDGLHLVLSNGVLKALLVAGILISVGFASLQALAVFFLRQNLHASASLYGLLSGAQGAGALLGAVLGARLAERLGVGRLVWQAACLLGLLFILFSRLTSVAPAMTVLFLIGATFAVLEVAESPLLLRATPRESLGRVTALLFPAFGAVSALTSLVAGGLASAWRGSYAAPLGLSLGPIDAVITGGGCLVVVAGLYARSKLTPFPVSSPPLDEGSVPHSMQSHSNL